VGQAVTDSSGTACIATSAPLSFGASTVSGTFGGTQAYLPSSAAGSLLVPGAPKNGLTGGLLLPPGGGVPPVPGAQAQPQPQPGTGVESQPAASIETLTQAQTQAQSEAQASTVLQVQPGVMVQRQRRTQVALQEQAGATQTVHQASAMRRAGPAPIAVVTMGLMTLGFGILARRPRWALGNSAAEQRRRATGGRRSTTVR
jgi:hypothetical protein